MATEKPGLIQKQRVGAYAVIIWDAQVLLTRLASHVSFPQRWTLPGGGIDHGESPEQALIRELHEETGHQVAAAKLHAVGSRQFVGTAPSGQLEDFHQLQIVYRVTVAHKREPVVHEVGGSTDHAAWVPLAELDTIPLTESARAWIRDVAAT